MRGWTLLRPPRLCIGTMGCEPPLQLCRPYKVFSHHLLGARDAQTFVLSVAVPIHKRMVRKFLGKDSEKEGRERKRSGEKEARARWTPGAIVLVTLPRLGVTAVSLGGGGGIYDGPDAAPRATETPLILVQGKAEVFHSL